MRYNTRGENFVGESECCVTKNQKNANATIEIAGASQKYKGRDKRLRRPCFPVTLLLRRQLRGESTSLLSPLIHSYTDFNRLLNASALLMSQAANIGIPYGLMQKAMMRALIGFNYCAKLYEIEKDLREQYSKKENYYDERYKTRLKKSKPLIEEFIGYVDKELENAVPQSPLVKL